MRKLSHDQNNMISRDPFLAESMSERYNKLTTNSHVFNQTNIQTRSFSNNITEPTDINVNKLIGLALSRKQISNPYHHDAYPYFMRS